MDEAAVVGKEWFLRFWVIRWSSSGSGLVGGFESEAACLQELANIIDREPDGFFLVIYRIFDKEKAVHGFGMDVVL